MLDGSIALFQRARFKRVHAAMESDIVHALVRVSVGQVRDWRADLGREHAR